MTDPTAKLQRGRPFKKGESGNPTGRPKGIRNQATLAIESLLDGEAEALGRKAVELALQGDTTALRLCLERISPPRKDRAVVFDLPPIVTGADASKAMAGVLAAVADGTISTNEGEGVARLIEAFLKSLETAELEARIAALEHMRDE